MKQENLIYFADTQIENAWTEYFFRKACKSFAEEQVKNEDWYLNAILNLNKDGKYFRDRVNKKKVRGGDRKKDLLYDLWTEEDIRLGIARHLHEASGQRCSIHGQVYLKKRYQRGRKKGSVKRQTYPDLYFVVKKEREWRDDVAEKNVESGVVEIKYFTMGWQERHIREHALKDIKKLVSYCERGLKPPADGGFFICVDETGKAGYILEDLFRRKFRRKDLAYAVITPAFTRNMVNYPREYEKTEQSERAFKYIMDAALGKLCREMPKLYKPSKISADGYSFFFRLRGNLKKGWVALQFKRHSKQLRPERCQFVIKASEDAHIDGLSRPVSWNGNKDCFEYPRKKPSKYREYTGIKMRRRNLRSLKGMEEIADKIVKIARQMHERAE